MVKKYLGTGLGLIGTGVVVGSIPNLSGTATETTLKGKFSEGLGNVGKVLPTYGKVVGTKMVFDSFVKLKKPMKKLKSSL